ncbi:MAG: glycerophosphodiester phosphodiesterase family protein [Planctomycetota bacterium]
MTRPPTLPPLAAALLLTLAAPPGHAAADEADPLIVAHRGASHDAPENTLAAFRLAWEQGADVFECDVWLTADDRIVCLHDKTTGRTAGGDKGTGLSVTASTLAQLRTVEVGAWKHERFRGEPIPLLADALATVPAHGRVFVEVKDTARIVPRLARVLAESGLRPDQLTVISFDARVVAASKAALPEVEAHWLTGFKIDQATDTPTVELDQVLATLALAQADGLGARARPDHFDAAFVAALRDHGYRVNVWTVNDPDVARFYADLNVDAITTDRPALSRFMTITIAEDVLRLLPKGTHDPALFIRPTELSGAMKKAGLKVGPTKGLGPRGLNRRGDFVFGPVPTRAIIYMGIAHKGDRPGHQ